MESVYINCGSYEEISKNDLPHPSYNGRKEKIGEIHRWHDNSIWMQCGYCSQEFNHYTEFILHVNEHFNNVDSIGNTIKQEFDEPTLYEPNTFNENEDTSRINRNPLQDHDNLWSSTHFEDDDKSSEDDTTDDWFGPECPKIPKKSISEIDAIHEFSKGEHFIVVNNLYTCLKCNHQMKKRSHFYEHLSTHVNHKNIYCPVCKKPFLMASYVARHCKRVHKQDLTVEDIRNAQNFIDLLGTQLGQETIMPSEIPQSSIVDGQYRCLHCNKWFSQLKYVQRHLRMVHTKLVTIEDIKLAQPIAYGAMKESYGSEEDVSNLVETVMDGDRSNEIVPKDEAAEQESQFVCAICQKTFKNASSLRKHRLIHSGNLYFCPYCERSAIQKRYIYDHIVAIHNIQRSLIDSKTIKVISSSELTNENEISSYECYLCKRTISKKSLLIRHMRTHVHASDAAELCPICGVTFKTKATLQQHQARHEYENSFGQIKCMDENCTKVFTSLSNMRQHHRASHRTVALSCRRCGEEFPDPDKLKRHKKRLKCHPPVQCKVCDKMISRNYYTLHMRLHMNAEKYPCPECDKLLVSKGSLRKHMFIHKEPVELKCDVCPKIYRRTQKLLVHRRKHVQPMPFICPVCQLGFLSKDTLSRHENMKHRNYNINVVPAS